MDVSAVIKLKTPSGWYVCTQLDELQAVCEFLFYKRPGTRYNRDFYSKGVRLPFIIRDATTEDRSFRMLQTVSFEQAHQLVCFHSNLRPRLFKWKSPLRGLPKWIWDQPPYPYIDDDGYRRVSLNSVFYYANEQDKALIDRHLELIYSDYRLMFPNDYDALKEPHLIIVSWVPHLNYAIATPVVTEDLLPLVNQWQYYLGMRNLAYSEQREFSNAAANLIDNLILGVWPPRKIDGHEHMM